MNRIQEAGASATPARTQWGQPRYAAHNEPVLGYAPGSAERAALATELRTQGERTVDVPLVIAGRAVMTSTQADVVCPHDHAYVLARTAQAGQAEAQAAIAASQAAAADWASWPLEARSRIFLKAAELLAGPWRQRLNAATMLGQSKTAVQAEIDSACELIDFLRFNVQFAQEIAAQQPLSSVGVRNSTDHRPLEGFVYAVTPFNFTAIGGNLAIAPALMGNTVIWKPSATASLSNYLFMELLHEAGLPPGVINFLPGDAQAISAELLACPHLAGIHFTGSTAVFDQLWLQTAQNLPTYRAYPRLVGETGGKDFVVAHASADVDALCVALLRGAYEYQGQKCSAASRAYIPASLWPLVKAQLLDLIATLRMGDVTDFGNFMGAVIDRRAFTRLSRAIAAARDDSGAQVLTAANPDDRVGYFVPPTLVEVADPTHALMTDELFGPVLAVHVYADATWPELLKTVDTSTAYALTGAVFAQDRAALAEADAGLRNAAGNFYVNDKPTGAVVGQQPFGGARRSGTNDKAGSALNLLRWVSPRTVKETLVPPTDHRYPHMASA
ncbi:L-glutamate gamma-semialdehyde dehydrogenase [Roseateles asaccharophilus]|uniref:L-glutamate gamma-semialdehyde dehydrogenase n=1 Tax=Roseateles asaccharophilus TaxID=582607 RepID=A0ABU2A8X5_9BURK|nr:L-glutamate gamma-semialdehyde dehydrogenase [Roseateles asaccharophilus]MDR7333653.1 1-pyrroline-5-carboxylate dehydrogenase [Roseateles asaccharophilus]